MLGVTFVKMNVKEPLKIVFNNMKNKCKNRTKQRKKNMIYKF